MLSIMLSLQAANNNYKSRQKGKKEKSDTFRLSKIIDKAALKQTKEDVMDDFSFFRAFLLNAPRHSYLWTDP